MSQLGSIEGPLAAHAEGYEGHLGSLGYGGRGPRLLSGGERTARLHPQPLDLHPPAVRADHAGPGQAEPATAVAPAPPLWQSPDAMRRRGRADV